MHAQSHTHAHNAFATPVDVGRGIIATAEISKEIGDHGLTGATEAGSWLLRWLSV